MSTLPLTWSDKKNSPLLDDFIAKYGPQYCMTAEEINDLRDAVNEMATIQQSALKGATTTSTIPTDGNIYAVVGEGTYTNWGGMVVPANNFGILSRVDGNFSVSLTEISFDDYIKIINLSKYTDSFIKTINLFDKTKATDGYVLNLSTGDVSVNSAWFVSDYIYINKDEEYYINVNSFVSYYDYNQVFISGEVAQSLSIPTNTVYIRISVPLGNKDTYQIEHGNSFSGYSSYGEFIKNDSIDLKKTNFYEESINLFDKTATTDGYVLDTDSGSLLVNASYFTSDFIPINELTNYYGNVNSFYVCYDINESRLRGGVSQLYSTPSDAEFIRVSALISVKDTYQLELGSSFTTYNPFGIWINPDNIKPTKTDTINTTTKIVRNGGTIGTDCDFTDIKSALDSITDNTYYNRYILDVKNGTYDISLESYNKLGLKNYVDIVGQSKNGVQVINRRPSLDGYAATFDPVYYDNAIEYASLRRMTIISHNAKGPIHIDCEYSTLAKGGTIEVINCDLLSEDEEVDGSPFYSVCLALGLRSEQRVVATNVNANGLMYAHNSTSDVNNKGCFFEMYNCRLTYTNLADLYTYAKDTFIMHNCILNYLQVESNNITGNKRSYAEYSFDINLVGNKIGYIVGRLAGATDENQDFWNESFGGRFGVLDSNIHNFCKNNTSTNIPINTLVSLDVKVKEMSIKPWVVGSKLYGITLDEIDVKEVGTVQYNGWILMNADGTTPINVGDEVQLNSSRIVEKYVSGYKIGQAMGSILTGTGEIRVDLIK